VLFTVLYLTPLAAYVTTMTIAPALSVYPAMITFAIAIPLGMFAERRWVQWTTKPIPP
jgi:hypothetical protein